MSIDIIYDGIVIGFDIIVDILGDSISIGFDIKICMIGENIIIGVGISMDVFGHSIGIGFGVGTDIFCVSFCIDNVYALCCRFGVILYMMVPKTETCLTAKPDAFSMGLSTKFVLVPLI